ncbi:toxin-antitoxin system YwqK family antitoxin [Helicobacter bilis]|uniref:toxin-antitoxin system YwqK family antitoxin n=1 Tax=Helicobacter bilis TaxID=37372 RepID=UPI001F1BDCE8|nr:toxin-antitoxin system YwqK family antitoxin [Helicobacter bilis]
MKHCIKLTLSVLITYNIGYANTLKMCQSEKDKIEGCIERIYTYSDENYNMNHVSPVIADMYEFPYKNGKLEGVAKSYGYGEIVGIYPYKNGKLNGIVIENGSGTMIQRHETPYKDDKIDGVVKEYHHSILSFETSYKDGKVDDIVKRYDENGNLKQETPYKNNVIDGVEKRYYENGDLIAEITYKNEKIISGKCGDGKAFSNAHLHNLEKHYDIDFIIKKICEKP